jgi:hypothetical protein
LYGALGDDVDPNRPAVLPDVAAVVQFGFIEDSQPEEPTVRFTWRGWRTATNVEEKMVTVRQICPRGLQWWGCARANEIMIRASEYRMKFVIRV